MRSTPVEIPCQIVREAYDRAMRRTPIVLAAALLAMLVTDAAFAAAAPRPTGGYLDPRDPMFEGPSSMTLTVKDANRVRAGFRGHSAPGSIDRNGSNTVRPGDVWDWGDRTATRTPRMKRFLRPLFHAFRNKGHVVVGVRVAGGGSSSEWKCRLTEKIRESRCHPADVPAL